jgi:DNA-3-methyladenine glycosylase
MKIEIKNRLQKEFYLQRTEIVAKELLGKILVFRDLAGKIVETEAYIPENDEANHSARGKTKRNAAMHEEGGILYVYKIYGVHHCINVVTEVKDKGCAVLIRALQPLVGIDLMKKNRKKNKIEELCKGPGNVAKAFGFTTDDNYNSLLSDDLYIVDNLDDREIVADKRIGISKAIDLPLRFYYANDPYVSGKKIK